MQKTAKKLLSLNSSFKDFAKIGIQSPYGSQAKLESLADLVDDEDHKTNGRFKSSVQKVLTKMTLNNTEENIQVRSHQDLNFASTQQLLPHASPE